MPILGPNFRPLLFEMENNVPSWCKVCRAGGELQSELGIIPCPVLPDTKSARYPLYFQQARANELCLFTVNKSQSLSLPDEGSHQISVIGGEKLSGRLSSSSRMCRTLLWPECKPKGSHPSLYRNGYETDGSLITFRPHCPDSHSKRYLSIQAKQRGVSGMPAPCPISLPWSRSNCSGYLMSLSQSVQQVIAP
jgi:hypothetical protein